jgi:rhomboid protease GluP
VTQTPNPPDNDRAASYPEIESVPPPPVSSSPGTVLVELPKTRPIVTYTLLAVTIFIYILQEAGKALYGVDLVTGWGLKVNEMILQGQFWRLITPMFLHGSILHIAFNMYALLAIGPGLERYYGHTRILALYFISGFAGNVASFMFSAAPSLGSSTAIFGLLGAEGVFLYRNQRI